MAHRRKSSRERTAIHEAGHAVAAYALKREFKHITIMPKEDSFGHILYEDFNASFQPDTDPMCMRKQIEAVAMTSLAGLVAESIFYKKRNLIGGFDDCSHAFDLLSYLSANDQETTNYIERIQERTVTLLSCPSCRAAIKALANTLLEKQTINYKSACQIIRTAIQEVDRR